MKERIGCIESDDLNESIQFVKEKKKCLEKLPSQAIAPLRSSQWKTSPSDYFSLVTKNSKSYGAKVEPSTIFISNNAARSDEFRISAAANENAPFIKVPPLYINFVKKLQKIYKIFMCQKFFSPPSRQFANRCDLSRTGCCTNDSIACFSTKANVNDKLLIASNACIVCQIPCVFMHMNKML